MPISPESNKKNVANVHLPEYFKTQANIYSELKCFHVGDEQVFTKHHATYLLSKPHQDDNVLIWENRH